ncbi:hypothetical protein ACFQL4_02200 [Halosimplex aquaticum]
MLDALSRVLVDGAWVFVFADDDTVPEFRECVEESPFTYRRTCVWDREKFGMGYYHRVQHYPILTATNGETDRYIQGRGTVYRALKHDGEASDSDYPTGKPVALPADARRTCPRRRGKTARTVLRAWPRRRGCRGTRNRLLGSGHESRSGGASPPASRTDSAYGGACYRHGRR